VTTDDPGLAAKVRMLQAHGSLVKYEHEQVGVNARLDAVQATFLRAKLRRLEAWNEARRRAAAAYAGLLSDIAGVRVPSPRSGNTDVWHLYVTRVNGRDRIVDQLRTAGIGTGIHYPTPVHLTSAYAHLGYRRGQLPVAEAAARSLVSLPMFPHLRLEQQIVVRDAVRAAAVLCEPTREGRRA